MKSKRGWVKTNRLKTTKIFGSIFPRDEKMVDAIAEHMKLNGYDESQPIIVWDRTEEKNNRNALYIVDGHTRKCSAVSIKLSSVYVARIKFPDEDEALQYAIHNQRDRRNITDADIMRCIEAVDKRKRTGRKSDAEKLASLEANSGKSAEETAKIVGTSKTKVEKARTIIAHADDKTKQEVNEGKKSINKGYNETQQKRKIIGFKNEIPTSPNSVIRTVTNQMNKIARQISEQVESANNIKLEVYQALIRSYEDLQDEMARLEAAVDVNSFGASGTGTPRMG